MVYKETTRVMDNRGNFVHVEAELDVASYAVLNELAQRAIRNKSKRAGMMHGQIKCKIVRIIPAL